MTPDLPPAFVLAVFQDLRRRQLGVGPADLTTLRSALRAGFGWRSDADLVELCVTLWAKAADEADLIRALFARHAAPTWDLRAEPAERGPAPADPAADPPPSPSTASGPSPIVVPAPADPALGLPPLPELAAVTRHVVFAEQFPITRRAVAQAFRRLRRPVAVGAATQLDVAATVARRTRTGVVTPAVLVPRRRNKARLLLLIDRQGSMVPFHPYVDHVRDALVIDGGLDHVDVGYFHDTPVQRPQPHLLRTLTGPFSQLDPLLYAIEPSLTGTVFADAEMLDPLALDAMVDRLDHDTGVVVISDAGAARGRLDPARNLATIAFFRALRARAHRAVWLNPLPPDWWTDSSAAQLARHIPMVPLDTADLHRAVEVLRGRPMLLDRAA